MSNTIISPSFDGSDPIRNHIDTSRVRTRADIAKAKEVTLFPEEPEAFNPRSLTPDVFPVGSELEPHIMVTPEMAEEWLKDFRYPGQRPLSQNTVEKYVFKIRHGEWVRQQIRLIHFEDHVFLTDAQHRLEAVKRSGIAIPVSCYNQRVATMREVAADYAAASGGKIRTRKDRLCGAGLLSQVKLSRKQFQSFTASLGPIIGGFEPATFSGAVVYSTSFDVERQAGEEWMAHARQYFDAVGGCTGKVGQYFARMPVASVGIVTFRYEPQKAWDFWHGTVLNDGLKSGDPRRALLLYLINNPGNTPPGPVYARIVAQIWNAFWAGRTYRSPQRPASNQVIKICGTPYDGKLPLVAEYAREEE